MSHKCRHCCFIFGRVERKCSESDSAAAFYRLLSQNLGEFCGTLHDALDHHHSTTYQTCLCPVLHQSPLSCCTLLGLAYVWATQFHCKLARWGPCTELILASVKLGCPQSSGACIFRMVKSELGCTMGVNNCCATPYPPNATGCPAPNFFHSSHPTPSPPCSKLAQFSVCHNLASSDALHNLSMLAKF